MFSSNLVAVLSILTLASPGHSYPSNAKQDASESSALPACGPVVQSCQCPEGNIYSSVATYGFYPASAKDVQSITASSFSDLSYIGLNVTNSTGQGFDIGSSRTFTLDWDAASEPISVTEVLNTYNEYPENGGFNMTWDMGNLPFRYTRPNGEKATVGGFWSYEELRQVGDYSFFLWSTWSCFGDVFDFNGFHELVFHRIAQILKEQGKSDGSIIGFTTTG
ncbi:unnamed protein product [Clonostachys rosea f. rosea IK726]|uniref:Uncharacterized protein n=2 Tax=Bionectria ochroleuca TaxID=29856 RepID=A0A0B7KHF0_BIOOC|nr:unnamed protein product [Clonostachys rosea f. rosea IK726]